MAYNKKSSRKERKERRKETKTELCAPLRFSLASFA